jgi:glycine betaine catabolism B
MKKFECGVCGFVYDPEKGVPEMGIPPGTPFEDLPADFCCPVCGASKDSFSAMAPSAPLTVTIDEIIPRTPSAKSFRFGVPHRADFKPGQYLVLTLEGDRELTRCLSISNSPTEEGYLEVTKRITGSRFSQILERARPGYEAAIQYPMGTFTFEGEFEKIAMLSGGIGITPLRSICQSIVDRKLGTDVCLLDANRSAEEIAFQADFERMQKEYPHLKVVLTVSRAGQEWTGRTGRIDAALVAAEIPDYRERCFYVCGPPQMVAALTGMLRSELSIPETQVKTENFLGY